MCAKRSEHPVICERTTLAREGPSGETLDERIHSAAMHHKHSNERSRSLTRPVSKSFPAYLTAVCIVYTYAYTHSSL